MNSSSQQTPANGAVPSSTNHFRNIGDIAAATDALEERDDVVKAEGDNEQQEDEEGLEHPVEQIESLCMECGENVSPYRCCIDMKLC